jgi:transglutaminase-like putative cysteine protease
MHFAIRFLTEYVYDAPVSDNLNALRVRPATTSTQRCDEFTVRIEPEARVGRHSDYFGTEVLEFGIVRPHTRLNIDVRARVVTAEPAEPPDVDWAALDTEAYGEAAGEFLLPAGDEPFGDVIDELCAAVRRPTPLATLECLYDLIPDRYEYRSGATFVGTTVSEFLAAGAGVCQDYVHLGLIMLRRNGIAARYVSGYLWAAPKDEGADSVEVETHAWLEALLPGAGGRGEGGGEPQTGYVGPASAKDGWGEPVWVGADPTNRRLAGERHVKIGHGRHYADVPPVRGVYQGSAGSRLDASVHMTRLDPQTSARA